MKKEIENTRQILGEFYKTLLAKKYMDYCEKGKKLPKEQIEDVEIYNSIKEAYKLKKVEAIKKIQEEKKVEYTKLLSQSFRELSVFTGSEFVDECMRDIFSGKIEQAQNKLLDLKNRVKVIRARSEEDCKDYASMCTFRSAKQTKPFRTKLFGVRIEVLDKQTVCIPKAPKRLNVKKAKVNVPYDDMGRYYINQINKDKGISK